MRKLINFRLLAALMLLLCIQACRPAEEPKARYVFYFIGDGMGINQVLGTEMYRAEKEGYIGTKSLNFTGFPVTGYASTFSKYNSVTCSAAAGTALATGVKTKNGTIGMDSLHKEALYSVAVKAAEAGKKVGIMTSVSLDHATPAAFYAHQPQRTMYYEIGKDLPAAGFDFYGGSGFLKPEKSGDPEAVALFDLFEREGYTLVRGMADCVEKSAAASRLILIREEGKDVASLPYVIDREPGDLTLAEITRCAVDFLERDNEAGFFMMVEGGKIDWACHSNDAGTVFREVEDLAEAVEIALDFYRKHPDETLIVITADHETGGISLGRGQYAMNLKALSHQKISKDMLTVRLKELRESRDNRVSWDDIRLLLEDKLGFWKDITLSQSQEKRLRNVYDRTFVAGKSEEEKSLYATNEQLVSEAFRILNEIAMIGWTNGGHSAGAVPVYAIGAGASRFAGAYDNTDIPRKIAAAGGY